MDGREFPLSEDVSHAEGMAPGSFGGLLRRLGAISLEGLQALGATYALVPPPSAEVVVPSQAQQAPSVPVISRSGR